MANIGLLVYDISRYGGAERVAISLTNELSKYHSVSLISCFNEDKKPIDALKNSVNFFVLSDTTKSLTFSIYSLSNRLKNIIRKQNIDILINITAGVNTVGILSTFGTSAKTIYAEHSNLLNKSYGIKHQVRQWLGAKCCDYVVTLTKKDQKEFEKAFHIKNKCSYIYNWFESDATSSVYDHNSKKIITVGRLESVKGYDRLIEVAKSVFDKHPEWSWDIYGEGSLRSFLEESIKANNLNDNLFLMGNCNQILTKYKDYSFFVMTSYYEGLPLVLLEAKSRRLPVISFDCPTGPSEIIKNGYDGYLVENGNISQMIEKIELLINNQSYRIEFSNHSTEVLEKFKKKNILNEWLALIDDLLKKEEVVTK